MASSAPLLSQLYCFTEFFTSNLHGQTKMIACYHFLSLPTPLKVKTKSSSKNCSTLYNCIWPVQFIQQVQPFSRLQQLLMTHLNPSKVLPLFSDKEQLSNVISQHLQGWSKNTSSRFGLKLYTFTPKKHVTPIKQEVGLPESSIVEDTNKEPQQMKKKQMELATPQQRSQNKQKKNRATTTHAKQQSESSSQYMPTKSSKTIKKRLSKKAEKQIKKAILF